jgi:hypothetical protein
MSGGGNPLEGIGHVFESVGSSIGHAFESVGKGIGQVGKAIEKNPMQLVEVAALTLMTGGIGAIAAEAVLGMDAIMAASEGYAAAFTAIQSATQASIVSSSVTALNGGSVDQIATNGVVAGLTAGIGAGLTASQALNFTVNDASPTVNSILNGVTGRTVSGLVGNILQGKNPTTGLIDATVAATLTSSLSSDDLTGLSKAASSVLGNATGAAITSAVSGKDWATAFGSSLAGSAAKIGLSSALSNYQKIMPNITTDVTAFQNIESQVRDIQNQVTSEQNTYKALESYANGGDQSALQHYAEQKFEPPLLTQYDADGNPIGEIANPRYDLNLKPDAALDKQLAAMGITDANSLPRNEDGSIDFSGAARNGMQTAVNNLNTLNDKLTPLVPAYNDAATKVNTDATTAQNIQDSLRTFNESLSAGKIDLSNLSDTGTANSTQIAAMYAQYLGRTPDPSEVEYWQSRGLSPAEVAKDIKTSSEANDYNVAQEKAAEEARQLAAQTATQNQNKTNAQNEAQILAKTGMSPDAIASTLSSHYGLDNSSARSIAENVIATLTGSGNVQASDVVPTGAPFITNGVYKQSGAGWDIVGKDPQGNDVVIKHYDVWAGVDPKEGSSAGSFTVTPTNAKDGVPFDAVPTTSTADQGINAQNKDTAYAAIREAFDSGKITEEQATAALTAVDKQYNTNPGAAIDTNQIILDAINTDVTKGGTTGTGGGVTGTGGGVTGITGVTGTGGGVTGITGGGGTTGGDGTGTGGDGTGTGGDGTGTGGDGAGTTVTGGGGTTTTGTGGDGAGTTVTGGGGTTTTGTGGGTTKTTTSTISPLVMSTAASSAYNPFQQYGGIQNLTPGLTQANEGYTLAGLPSFMTQQAPLHFASGGVTGSTYNPFSTSDSSSGISGGLTPGLTKAQINYVLTGLPGHAAGGSIQEEEHVPEFYSVGGLSSMDNTYVKGDGDGTSDSVKAMLANGEFVIPADVVSDLGNGSNDSGAKVLDELLAVIREHKNNHDPRKLPPDSKGPLAYLLDAKRNLKA